MFWRILPHASCCLASDKLFLLDLRQDRYFCVPEKLTASMLGWLERGFTCAPPRDIARVLKRCNILRSSDPEPTNALKERIAIPEHIDGLRTTGDLTLSKSHQWLAITATWTRLRLLPLRHILAARQSRTLLPVRDTREAVLAFAAGYEAGRSFTPIARNCLLDSLALDSLLARRGLSATLVFGVCPTPFSAHCWLQTSELILNDSFDHVSRFTPIYAS